MMHGNSSSQETAVYTQFVTVLKLMQRPYVDVCVHAMVTTN